MEQNRKSSTSSLKSSHGLNTLLAEYVPRLTSLIVSADHEDPRVKAQLENYELDGHCLRKNYIIDQTQLENRKNSVSPKQLEDELKTKRDTFDAETLKIFIKKIVQFQNIRFIADNPEDAAVETLKQREHRLKLFMEDMIEVFDGSLDTQECLFVELTSDRRIQICQSKQPVPAVFCRLFRWPCIDKDKIVPDKKCKMHEDHADKVTKEDKIVCVNIHHYHIKRDIVDSAVLNNSLPWQKATQLFSENENIPVHDLIDQRKNQKEIISFDPTPYSSWALVRYFEHDVLRFTQTQKTFDTGLHRLNINGFWSQKTDFENSVIGLGKVGSMNTSQVRAHIEEGVTLIRETSPRHFKGSRIWLKLESNISVFVESFWLDYNYNRQTNQVKIDDVARFQIGQIERKIHKFSWVDENNMEKNFDGIENNNIHLIYCTDDFEKSLVGKEGRLKKGNAKRQPDIWDQVLMDCRVSISLIKGYGGVSKEGENGGVYTGQDVLHWNNTESGKFHYDILKPYENRECLEKCPCWIRLDLLDCIQFARIKKNGGCPSLNYRNQQVRSKKDPPLWNGK